MPLTMKLFLMYNGTFRLLKMVARSLPSGAAGKKKEKHCNRVGKEVLNPYSDHENIAGSNS